VGALQTKDKNINQALLQSQEWPAPEVEEHRGVPILIWGEDFEADPDRRLNPPVYDYLGRGARLAFLEKERIIFIRSGPMVCGR